MSRESFAADAETTMPGPRAYGFPGGAQVRDEDEVPSGPVIGESDDHAHIIYTPGAGP